jgi:diadenosine tetraphosphate (Ap4A) HIT family hydrolase
VTKPLSVACDKCGFGLTEPIAALAVSDLGFISDDRFPGRCVVMLHQHATELFDVSPAVRHAFADDVSAAARAIKLAVSAFKMNYEILGNADPHVHCHLIPRQSDEPNPKVPAWLHPQAQSVLPAEKADEIKRRILAHLRQVSPAARSSSLTRSAQKLLPDREGQA